MEGEVGDDADFPRLRGQYETLMTHEMRGMGYVPVIGLGPFWSTEYNKEKNAYTFLLSIHGYYVGRKQACQIEGITVEGLVITRQNKSNPSSKESE